MNYKMVGRFLSQIIAIEGVFMIPALLIGLFADNTATVLAFVYTLLIIAAVAAILYGLCHKASKLFSAREGMICVGFSWIVMSLLGALPFVFSGAIPHYIDALFETI